MAPIRVHEFVSLDGVIDAPTWTADYGFDPRMGEAIGQVVRASDGILYPVTRGSGPRLFDADAPPASWDRVGAELYDNGVFYLKLTPAS